MLDGERREVGIVYQVRRNLSSHEKPTQNLSVTFSR